MSGYPVPVIGSRGRTKCILLLIVAVLCAKPTFSQKSSCSDPSLGIEDSNKRIVNSFTSAGGTTRCYRFNVPATGQVRVRVEPCKGPIPTVYVGNNGIGSSLSSTNFDTSSNTIVNGMVTIDVQDVGGSGAMYVLVENGDGTRDARFTVTTIFPVGREPVVVDPQVRYQKRRDTSVILQWIPIAENTLYKEDRIEYGVFAWDSTSINPFSKPSNPDVDGDSNLYFLQNACNIESFAETLRPYSSMGNATDVNPLFSFSAENLSPGHRYEFIVVARDPNQIYAVYPSLTLYMWPLGINGVWSSAVLVVLTIICLIEYKYWLVHCTALRDHMLVGSHELTAEDEYFVPSEYDGYYYVVPEHLIKVLKPDEKVVWAGRPDFYSKTKHMFWAWAFINGTLFFVVLIVGWFARDVFNSYIFIPYFVVAFLTTMYFFVGMVGPATKVYALTTHRAITYRRLVWFLPAATSVAYHEMAGKDIRTKLLPDETGHVWFDTRWTLIPCCGKRRHGFEYVREAVRAIQHIKYFREEFYSRHLAADSDDDKELTTFL